MHSLVDFNLYLPANSAVLSWIAGLSEGLQYRPRLLPFRQPLVIDVEPLPAGTPDPAA